MADDGEYLCVGSSELGTVMTRATLTVIGEFSLLLYIKNIKYLSFYIYILYFEYFFLNNKQIYWRSNANSFEKNHRKYCFHDKAVYISLYTKALWKGMNSSVPHPW